MKIVVIGSGLIGLTTAYYLKKRDHDVTVIDRQEGPGLETSFANGALLTPGMPEPWNTPGCWRLLLSSLGRSDAPLQLRWRALPALLPWGIAFLRNSRRAAFERSTLRNLRLALYSLEVMESLRSETGIEYARTARGALKIFRDPDVLDRAAAASRDLAAEGLALRRISGEETVELEPALAPIRDQLAGAMHYMKDETGDAYTFCIRLAERTRAQGVELRFGTEVTALEARGGRVTAVKTDREHIVGDRYVVAAGSYSTPLLKPLGIRLPVRPAKGYSVTFNRCWEPPLRIPLVDDDFHAAVVPFAEGIRAAGTAEFAGFDLTMRPERIRNLLTLLTQVFPQAKFDPAEAKTWCGLRPMSADGVPIIGPTPISNLFVSTGHGHLGWTMAAGSGQLLADLISGEAPVLDPEPYVPSRFA
jgi:D-amino-acid dehydrogenase